jgi:hypothetical protein
VSQLILRSSVVAQQVSIGALRFRGNDDGTGTTAIDRLIIVADGAQPINVGAGDYAVDFWINADAENAAGDFLVGANYSWPSGNVLIDRDRFGLGRAWGVSLSQGRITYGVKNVSNSSRTIRGTTDVRGNDTHVRIQRRFSDGEMWIFVNGTIEAQATGPTGDISCPDTDSPDNQFCVGAEKFDADLENSPSFYGLAYGDFLVESLIRTSNFTPPSAPRSVNGNTFALYYFDEGSGINVSDENGNQSPGTLSVGGSPASPTWEAASPY